MKFYAVIDTNVLVSAAMKPDSVPGQVLELVLDGVIIPVFDKTIIEEYRNVLLLPKYRSDCHKTGDGSVCRKARGAVFDVFQKYFQKPLDREDLAVYNRFHKTEQLFRKDPGGGNED